MDFTPTTELEAVNTMLQSIQESPVSSVTNPGSVDAVTAIAILREVSRAVQSKGYSFNTEYNYPLPANGSGEIIIPANCLEVDVDPRGPDASSDLVRRGQRLYDRYNRTYAISRTVRVEMILMLDFEDLPETARHYIALRAARIFQARMVGSDSLDGFTEQDEMEAKADFRRAENRNADHNVLNNYAAYRVIKR